MKHLQILANFGLWLLAAALLPALGCGRTEAPAFSGNRVAYALADVSTNQQQVIADVLFALYGTPNDPFVPADTGLDLHKIRLASGPVGSNAEGVQRGLYRQHCGHCHGTTGDGRGPTAGVLNPYPRDYRLGKYKFKSTLGAAEPTDLDLERILREGIMGTAMPSFDLLPEDEIAALVEYVKYLSMRGQTELGLIAKMSDMGADSWKELAKQAGVWGDIAAKEGVKSEADEEKLTDAQLLRMVLGSDKLLEIERAFLAENVVGEGKVVDDVVRVWKQAPEAVIQPVERSEMSPDDLLKSIAAGRELFYDGKRANCVKCHGPSQLGDGQMSDYDDWTKSPISGVIELTKRVDELRKTLPSTSGEERARLQASLSFDSDVLNHDTFKARNIIPRNLRQGMYRFGRRPLDLYRRVYSGISGTPMPAMGPAVKGGQGALKPEEVWNLIDYVRSLPYEAISKPPGYQKFNGREQL